MWIYCVCVVFSSLFGTISGQYSLGCPFGWELFANRCYKFEKDSPLIYEEADAKCWVEGATLLAVNSFSEHKFVSDWLMKHDLNDGSVWFTSGTYHARSIMWNGEVLIDNMDSPVNQNGNQFWANGDPPKMFETKFIRIAYVRGGPRMNGYGWEVVSPSIKSPYICEMSRENAQDRRIEERDFAYGQGKTNERYVERGPVILQQPQSVAVFGAPPSAFIECKAIGYPHPIYSWIRDKGTAVTSALNNRYTLSAGRFGLQDPERQDEGTYHCIVENKIGKIRSDPAKIIFAYLQSFSPVKPEDVYANKFEGSRISCQAPAAYPAATFGWFYRSIAEPIFEDNENMFVSSSGYLYFSEVQPTDSRKYFCSVTLITTSEFTSAIDQPPSRISLGVNLRVTGTGSFFLFLVIA